MPKKKNDSIILVLHKKKIVRLRVTVGLQKRSEMFEYQTKNGKFAKIKL